MSARSINEGPQRQCMASVDGILRVQHLPGISLAFKGFIPLFSSFKVLCSDLGAVEEKERTTKTPC